jgi:uncharacterized protein (DUF2235 family)
MSEDDNARAEVNVKAPGPAKRLVFCFDGTWNRLDSQTPTNVVLTAESVLPMARDGKAQVIFYDQGVGTGRLDRLSGGVFGAGLVDKLGDAYRFLTFNYTPGDQIYVLGFSRGAFTARSFVGMLRNCGIVSRSKAGRIVEAIHWYRNRRSDAKPNSEESRRFRADISPVVCVEEGEDEWRVQNLPGYIPGSSPLLRVKYLGVWDTVGALGVPARYRALTFFNRQYQFHDTELSSLVLSGRHAVATDEQRSDFTPSLWSNLEAMNAAAGADPASADAPYQERWFPGVHCGVGGGGDKRGLSDQSLAWVWDGAIRAGLSLDTSPGSRIFELSPDPASPLSPFDLARLSRWQRLKSGTMDRLWVRNDRVGPSAFRNISPSARRRWKMDASALPEGKAYRPKPLARFADDLDAWSAPPTVPPANFQIVSVEPGESLSKIALRQLGDAARWQEIFQLNQDLLDDPNHIYCGMPLRVPTRKD